MSRLNVKFAGTGRTYEGTPQQRLEQDGWTLHLSSSFSISLLSDNVSAYYEEKVENVWKNSSTAWNDIHPVIQFYGSGSTPVVEGMLSDSGSYIEKIWDRLDGEYIFIYGARPDSRYVGNEGFFSINNKVISKPPSGGGMSAVKVSLKKGDVIRIGEPQNNIAGISAYYYIGKKEEYKFTVCGASGIYGPTQSKIDSEYLNTKLQGSVTSLDGIQKWIVPESGEYYIEACGAKGGNSANARSGGKGAMISATVSLIKGEVLFILVGQKGINGTNTNYASCGGGGGSFVAKGPDIASSIPLIVAGGGGGAKQDKDGLSASMTRDGVSSAYAGGKSGNGGSIRVAVGGQISSSATSGGFAGGGFYTAGGQQGGSGLGRSGYAFIQGGLGGKKQDNSSVASSDGGFGGGGGGMHNMNQGAGGGGGYSGGGAGHDIGSFTSGGGGGSFVIDGAQYSSFNLSVNSDGIVYIVRAISSDSTLNIKEFEQYPQGILLSNEKTELSWSSLSPDRVLQYEIQILNDTAWESLGLFEEQKAEVLIPKITGETKIRIYAVSPEGIISDYFEGKAFTVVKELLLVLDSAKIKTYQNKQWVTIEGAT